MRTDNHVTISFRDEHRPVEMLKNVLDAFYTDSQFVVKTSDNRMLYFNKDAIHLAEISGDIPENLLPLNENIDMGINCDH